MKQRDDSVEKEDRRERYERRRGQTPIGAGPTPPRKRRAPYKREHVNYAWDDDEFEDKLDE